MEKPKSFFRDQKHLLGLVIFGVIAGWLSIIIYNSSISLYSQAESSITQMQIKRDGIAAMMAAARYRSTLLLQMYIQQDIFERDEINSKLNQQANRFVKGKQIFEGAQRSQSEIAAFNDILKLVVINQPIQEKAAELLMANDMQSAGRVLFNEALPNQVLIIEKFEALLDLMEKDSRSDLQKLSGLLSETHDSVFLLIGLVVFSVIFAFVIIMNRSRKRERELQHEVSLRTKELQVAHNRTRSLIENASDGIVTIDSNQLIVMFNPSAEVMFQYFAEEVLNKPLSKLLPETLGAGHNQHVEEFRYEAAQARMMDARSEVSGRRKNGSLFPAEISISKSVINGEMFFTAFVRDITERREAEAEIHRLAMYDSLTGLQNRHNFEARLDESIVYQQRFPEQVFGLLLLDLDLFKQVNDSYGHPVGDELLRIVARLLRENVREVDDVGRLGGDEFAILLKGLPDRNEAKVVARKLIETLSEPHQIENYSLTIGASIGITFCSKSCADASTLFRQADKMLYEAKNAGRNTFRIFSSEDNAAHLTGRS